MVLIILTILVFLLSGCFDIGGYKICEKSLDNIRPIGYEVIDYNSDYICCNEDAFFVWYLISDGNNSKWIGIRPNEDFVYWYEDDELIYNGNNETIKSWIVN